MSNWDLSLTKGSSHLHVEAFAIGNQAIKAPFACGQSKDQELLKSMDQEHTATI